MDEIEKMYRNSGIEKDRHCTKEGFCYFSECPKCDYYNYTYPKFTAEKQLELIKLLESVRDYTVGIDKFKGVYYVGCRSAGSNDKLWGSSNVFEDALAELINETWYCLTPEEKQQVKGILE